MFRKKTTYGKAERFYFFKCNILLAYGHTGSNNCEFGCTFRKLGKSVYLRIPVENKKKRFIFGKMNLPTFRKYPNIDDRSSHKRERGKPNIRSTWRNFLCTWYFFCG